MKDGRHAGEARGTVYRDGRLISFNDIAERPVEPTGYLNLNATVRIPGGTLTAYPSSAFPEFADAEWHFPKPNGGTFPHRVTDTCIFHLPLDSNATYHLVVESPRQKVQIEVPGAEGRRFEVKNADRKLGKPPDNPFDLRDFSRLAKLVGLDIPAPLPPLLSTRSRLVRMCDEIVVCPTAFCGEETNNP
jgi:hypothetical protein